MRNPSARASGPSVGLLESHGMALLRPPVALSIVVCVVRCLLVASAGASQDEAGDICAPDRGAGALSPAASVAEDWGRRRRVDAVAIATACRADGRVFTTELGEARVRTLRAAVSRRPDLSQIEVVEAATTSTNLGDACCDALLMRDVYHHFGDPAGDERQPAGLAQARRTPGHPRLRAAAGKGKRRRAIARWPSWSWTPDGFTRADEAGFTVLSTTIGGRRFMVVAQSPSATTSCVCPVWGTRAFPALR